MVISAKQQDALLNEQIREKEVRVITADGEQLGIMSSAQALEVAVSRDLDLVMISPQAKPPVCKIMNYGKYRFERAKKEKENRSNQTVTNIKELRLSPTTDEHDLMTKVNQAIKFLSKNDRVKVTVRFRGREVAYTKAGEVMLERFAEAISEYGAVDKKAKLEGRNMSMFISPKN